MMRKKYGDITFEISGSHPIVNILAQEFSLLPPSCDAPDIVFIFGKSLPKSKGTSYSYENLHFNEQGFYINDGSFKYYVKGNSKHTLTEVYLIPICNKKYPDLFHRFMHWNYMVPIENLAKNFLYNIFDYLTHIKLLNTGGAFVHASSIVKDNNAIIFPARGGVGKTSTLTKLIYEKGWRFLGDDLTIISKDGTVYLNPKYIQVYPYNLMQTPLLKEKLMRNRSILDRLNWTLYKMKRGLKGVRRRASPESLFSKDYIGEKGRISKAFFLVNHSRDEIIITKISSEDIALQCANIIIDELCPFSSYSLTMHSICSSAPIPTIIEVFEKSKANYERIFSKIDCYLIYLPKKYNHNKLVSTISKKTR